MTSSLHLYLLVVAYLSSFDSYFLEQVLISFNPYTISPLYYLPRYITPSSLYFYCVALSRY